MDWIIPVLLWFALTLLVAWRNTYRIQANIEGMYKLSKQAAKNHSIIVAGLIFLPIFVIMGLGIWLGKTHQIGEFGMLLFCVVGLLWWLIGYLLTGGNSRAS
ncbi:MAG: hypothetical protein LC131_18965 [Anaerolineae bacterium]|nr:hypothetical protein [Anaerolineae bacterium]